MGAPGPGNTAVSRIQRWFERLEQGDGQMAREDICFLMVQARHLVEASADPNAYHVLDFYADWIVHTKLDRSPLGLEMLRDITRELAENFTTTNKDVALEVSRVIGFRVLRSQLVAVFHANGLPVVAFEYLPNWKGFVGFLLGFLEGQPIEFPGKRDRRADAIYRQAVEAGASCGIVVEGLEIVGIDGEAHWVVHVGGNKSVRMVGRISLDEAPGSFLPPPPA